VDREGRQLGVSAPIVAAAVRVLRELGVRVADPPELHGYVDGPVADAVLDAGARALVDGAIGLTIARRLTPGSLGPLDYALFTSETWGAAIAMVARYYAVVSQRVRLTVEARGAETAIALRREPPHDANRHWVELSLGLITERARQSFGPAWQPMRVQFAHAAPAVAAGHTAWFGAPVAFDAAHDELVFATSWMSTRSHTAMGSLAQALESRLAELVPPDADPLVVRIRDAVARGLDRGSTEIAQVAAELAMSTRSLQRSLAQRGITYSDIVDDLRRSRALELLREGRAIAEVAERVGFADPSALFRAYRRWTGTTPGAGRAAPDDDAAD
jgi:AraC-like DNA-binding protein